MVQSIKAISSFVSTALILAGLAIVSTGGVRAEEVAPAVSKKTVADAEFSRFVENNVTPASPSVAAPAKAAPAATCEAGERNMQSLENLESVQQKFAELRRLQMERMAAKGWTAKEAAAAGEPVVLNGSGYNRVPSAPR